MTINKEATRKAIESLRNAREDKRARGAVLTNNGKGCACYFLATGLEIDVFPDTLTCRVIDQIVARTGLPYEIMDEIPVMNDAYAGYESPNTSPGHYKYSFAEIADRLEADIREREEDF